MEHEIREYDGLMELLEDLDREGITGFQRREAYTRFLNLQARMKGYVYGGGFELTPMCNFDCKMCYVHLNGSQMTQPILTTEQWLNIMQQAIDAGMMHADLTGGECLTHPGFKELYTFLRTRGVEVSVLTNGQLLTEEIADLFAQYPPSVVQITVYGSDEDAYEAVTGRRAFADVCAAIERLKKRGIHVFLPITPNRFMQEDTHALLEFLRNLGVEYGIGAGALPAREGTGRSMDEYAAEADLHVQLALDEYEYQRVKRPDLKIRDKEIWRIPRGFTPMTQIPCSSGQCTFHINWQGEMQPCIPYYTVKRSVLRYGLKNCWDWIKKQMCCYEYPEECGKCKYLRVCKPCPGEQTLGILNGPVNKRVCQRYEKMIEAGLLVDVTRMDCK